MIKKTLKDNYIFVLFIIFIAISGGIGFEPGLKIYGNFWEFLYGLITFLPVMFLLVGLFDVWVPKEKIEKHIGHGSGIIGAFWVTLLAMLQAGPIYGSFPIAYILRKKGASVRNIFIYLGAFSCIKIPMLTFEIGFMGLKFSILRTLISLPIFYIIGILMEKILGKDFQVMDGRS